MTGTPISTRAFILRSVDYRESDRILTLLTADVGKVSAIAKGARSSRRRFGGVLEPYAMLELSLETGRGRDRLFVVTEAAALQDNRGIAKDLDRLGAAALLTELARELLPENQPDGRMFDLLAASLALLASEAARVWPVAICAQLRALDLAGFAVSTGACNACGKPLPKGRKAFFDPRRGGIICSGCGGGPILLEAEVADALASLGESEPARAAGMDVPSGVLERIERALEIFVEEHLGRRLRAVSFRERTSGR